MYFLPRGFSLILHIIAWCFNNGEYLHRRLTIFCSCTKSVKNNYCAITLVQIHFNYVPMKLNILRKVRVCEKSFIFHLYTCRCRFSVSKRFSLQRDFSHCVSWITCDTAFYFGNNYTVSCESFQLHWVKMNLLIFLRISWLSEVKQELHNEMVNLSHRILSIFHFTINVHALQFGWAVHQSWLNVPRSSFSIL